MSSHELETEAASKPGILDFRAAAAESSLSGVGLAFTNLLLATFFVFFAIANAKSFLVEPRLSVFLIVVTETIVAIFLVVRRDPDETLHSWQAWMTTTFGTLAPFLLRPVEASADEFVGSALQIAGFILQISALIALNRCLGLLPAHRGVKSNGLYRWVRHPLYMAYVITYIGYFINNPSIGNLGIVISGTGFLIMRIRYEEGLLVNYPEYVEYASRIRWRLFPSVW